MCDLHLLLEDSTVVKVLPKINWSSSQLYGTFIAL